MAGLKDPYPYFGSYPVVSLSINRRARSFVSVVEINGIIAMAVADNHFEASYQDIESEEAGAWKQQEVFFTYLENMGEQSLEKPVHLIWFTGEVCR